jgi:hypothetical protein
MIQVMPWGRCAAAECVGGVLAVVQVGEVAAPQQGYASKLQLGGSGEGRCAAGRRSEGRCAVGERIRQVAMCCR